MSGLPQVYRTNDTTDQVLKRFLSIFGAGFNEIQSFADAFSTAVMNPQTCDVKFLPLFAQYLGMPVPLGATTDQIRELISNAAFLYSQRGTVSALTTVIRILTGWTITTNLTSSSIIYTNSKQCGTWNSVSFAALVAKIGWTAAYNSLTKLWSGQNLPQYVVNINIFCATNGDTHVPFKTAMLNSVLDFWVPIGTAWTFIIVS